MGIGSRLRSERRRLGLTQARLAALGGVQPNAQGRYESGIRVPRADYLASVARIGIDVLYVVTGQRMKNRAADCANGLDLPPERSTPSKSHLH